MAPEAPAGKSLSKPGADATIHEAQEASMEKQLKFLYSLAFSAYDSARLEEQAKTVRESIRFSSTA
jgi:hypothetical protein